MNKTKINLTAGAPLSDTAVIYDALVFLSVDLRSESWANRPVYDEDSGAYVSPTQYNAGDMAQKFALYQIIEQIIERIKRTPAENAQFTDDIPEITIEREFTKMEAATVCQCVVYYALNLERAYIARERDLYDSDNHYTGKPLQHFIDIAKKRATDDGRTIRKVFRKLGEI
jgi:uncharacterized protein (UPF0335 family)